MINWETAEFMYETGGMSYEDAIRSDWGIDPDEMENTPEDLKEQFITYVIKDKLLEIALRKRPWPGV